MPPRPERKICKRGSNSNFNVTQFLTFRFDFLQVNGLHASSPIIPFRETIVPPPLLDRVNENIAAQNAVTQPSTEDTKKEEKEETVRYKDFDLVFFFMPKLQITQHTANRLSTMRVRAIDLPESFAEIVDKEEATIQLLERLCNECDKQLVSGDASAKQKDAQKRLADTVAFYLF